MTTRNDRKRLDTEGQTSLSGFVWSSEGAAINARSDYNSIRYSHIASVSKVTDKPILHSQRKQLQQLK